VPLATLYKDPLQRFSVWEEQRGALPMLTTSQNSRLAAACLVSMATDVLSGLDPPRQLPGEVARTLRFLPGAPPDEARLVLHEMRIGGGYFDSWAAQLASMPASPAPPEWMVRLAAMTPHREVVADLFIDPVFNALADDLGSQFVMLVALETDVLRRRVVKFEHEQPVRPKERRVPLLRAGAELLETIGYKTKRIDFDRIGIGQSESHHIEVESPEQLEIVDAALTGFDFDTSERLHFEVRRADVRGDRVHMSQRERSRSTVAALRVRLRAELFGLPVTAPALAIFTAVTLLVLSARASDVNKEGGAALLLLGPALLAAFVAQPGEHPMATRMLMGMRVAVVLTGLCSFVAAAALAGDYVEKLDSIWTYTTVTACTLAGMLAIGLAIRLAGPLARAVAGRTRRFSRRAATILKGRSDRSDLATR
jgi:hypothetical protein